MKCQSWPGNMENKTNHLLSKLSVAIRVANENLMCEVGLHAGQAQILMELWAEDRQSQAELAKKLCVSPPTVNKMAKKLSDAGFVTIQRCPDDGRLKRVRLTAKGARIQPKVEEQLDKLETILLKDLSETERLLVPLLLERLHKNVLALITSG